MEPRSHSIDANGITHFVRDTGPPDAPVALLLHGFPDSSDIWTAVTPVLVDAGFRIIAPDLRGFGQTSMAARVAEYEINAGAIPDAVEILRALNISRAHIVGHDFGAPVAWGLAAQHPEIFVSLTAISVGHVRAYLNGGLEQLFKSGYILLHQMRGICEAIYRFNDWSLLRSQWSGHSDLDAVIANLSRPGRLTAGLNWYRANLSAARMIKPPPLGQFGEEIVRIPTLGLWSDGEKYLSEKQMKMSEQYVEAPWRYQRINDASHWIPYDQPQELAALLIDHWRRA